MTDLTSTSLIEIDGHPFTVLSSPGVEAVTIAAGQRVARAHEHLGSLLGTTADVTVKVLTPDAWSAHATFPVYGMPHFADDRTLVLAGEDNAFWRSVAPPLDDLPEAARLRLQRMYGGSDGGDDGDVDLGRFFDLLAVHELAHLFHLQTGRDFPRLWLQELFSNLALHSYLAGVEPGLLGDLETFPDVVVDLGHDRLAHHSLDDFERLYVDVGPANYGWYQCCLHVAAKRLHDVAGDALVERFWDDLLGMPADCGEADLLRSLERVHPALAEVATSWPPKA